MRFEAVLDAILELGNSNIEVQAHWLSINEPWDEPRRGTS